jgi:hypothetical protein
VHFFVDMIICVGNCNTKRFVGWRFPWVFTLSQDSWGAVRNKEYTVAYLGCQTQKHLVLLNAKRALRLLTTEEPMADEILAAFAELHDQSQGSPLY